VSVRSAVALEDKGGERLFSGLDDARCQESGRVFGNTSRSVRS